MLVNAEASRTDIISGGGAFVSWFVKCFDGPRGNLVPRNKLCPRQDSSVEALILHVTVFGEGGNWEVIRSLRIE